MLVIQMLLNSVVLNVNESIKTIEYDSSSQKTIFKFGKFGKTIKITLLGEKIISIKDNLITK